MKYEDVVKHLKQKKRTPNLLIGNGFSISYSPSIFSYNALSSFYRLKRRYRIEKIV